MWFPCWILNHSQWRIQDFPEVGAPTLGGRGRQHTILPNFRKNCMKLKEFGPLEGEGRASKILLCRSATDYGLDTHSLSLNLTLQRICETTKAFFTFSDV